MAAAVASARAIYKQQKAKNLNASDGLGKWAQVPPPSASKVSQVVPVSLTSIEDYDC